MNPTPPSTPISQCIRDNLEIYFKDIDGETPSGLYDMVLSAVEKPLLEMVMERAGNNQSQAAAYLGINRNTLHKKLLQHGLI